MNSIIWNILLIVSIVLMIALLDFVVRKHYGGKTVFHRFRTDWNKDVNMNGRSYEGAEIDWSYFLESGGEITDEAGKPIGHALDIKKTGTGQYSLNGKLDKFDGAQINFLTGEAFFNIGGTIMESHIENGVRFITKMRVKEVSLLPKEKE